MKIQGLQKMTLLDFPEHVACTVFLGGCDFRCPFCHNYELVERPSLSYPDDPMRDKDLDSGLEGITQEQFMDFLTKRRGLLDGVAITGGEPCLRKDLPEFIATIRDAGFLVKLDTNGNHPDMLGNLLRQNLVNFVSMDIKNSPEKYAETAGLMAIDLDPIKESISLLVNGDIPYEFRTTVMSKFHEDRDFHEIGKLINGAKKYFIQPFIDRDTVPDHSLEAPPLEDMRRFKDIASEYVEFVGLRGID